MTKAFSKRMHLWINDTLPGLDQPPVQVFETKAQLTADLTNDVHEGKRCFVTANSKTLVESLAETMRAQFEASRRILVVTSDTVGHDDVQSFLADVQAQALEYDVMLASPSIGTGIDISFPDKAKRVDVVCGFFEVGITPPH